MPFKTNLRFGLRLGILFCCPKESIERGTKIGFYHVEFLGGDRDQIGQIIDDARRERAAFRNLPCISSSFLASLKRRPRGAWGGGARVKAFTEISVSAYRVGCTGNESHGDISHRGPENTGQTQLDVARAKRLWRGMLGNRAKKSQTNQGFMSASHARRPLPKVGDTSVEDGN